MKIFKPVIMASAMAMMATGTPAATGQNVTKAPGGKFTPEVLNSFGRVSDPQVSPDGKRVLYGVTRIDIAANKSNRDLWVMDIDGKNATQLTNTPNSESNAVWIDGGKRIAFVYKDDKADKAVNQVWVMNADGTGRQCVSSMKKNIEGFSISPDEKKIIVISTVKYDTRAVDVYPDMPKSDARIIDDLMYRHWNEWVEEIPQPWVGDFDGMQVTNLKNVLEGTKFESPMRPWGGVEQLAWMPDSKSFIYVCRKKVGKDYALSTNSDLYLYDLASGNTTNLTEGMMGYDNNPVVSRSGKIAWISMEHDGYEADKNRIFVMDKPGGTKVDLTADWDYSVDAVAWSPDEKYLYFTAPYHGTIVGKNLIVTTVQSYSNPAEIYSVKIGTKPAAQLSTAATKLTAVNDELLASIDPISCRQEWVPTTDGKQMLTWVVLPPNFDPNKKYPSIFFCEGGPQSPVSQFWSYRWNIRIMANHGYVVILPNRRGMPGWGTEWNAEISGDYSGQNMKDYMAAADYMKKQSYIDGDHMGCVGASYGGYSVYWLAGHHNNRFACFLSHAGIFDLRAQYLETEEMWFVNWDLGGAPWDKDNATAMRSYREADPKNFVQNWDKPIMVTTGENDFRISYTQTMQAFNAARLRGIPTHMVLYPSECHWVQRPQNSIVWQREYFKWLDRWLMPDSEAAKQAAAQGK